MGEVADDWTQRYHQVLDYVTHTLTLDQIL
jgi:hypothetical protein